MFRNNHPKDQYDYHIDINGQHGWYIAVVDPFDITENRYLQKDGQLHNSTHPAGYWKTEELARDAYDCWLNGNSPPDVAYKRAMSIF